MENSLYSSTKHSRSIPQLRFSEFKEEWKERRLDEIVDRLSLPVNLQDNVKYQQIGIRSHGKGIFHKELVTGKEIGKKRVFWIKENALIINIVFAWEQAIAKTTEKEVGMIASHRFPMYIPKKNIGNLDYLLDLFLTKKGKYLLGLASPGGAGRNKTLGQNNFNELKIFLPTVQEQEKISSFIKSIRYKLQALKKKKALLEEYKKGIMQKIFSQQIRFKDDNDNEFPDWGVKKLREIGETFNGLSGKTKENFGTGKPYIQYKQIFGNSKINISTFGLVDVKPNEKQKRVKFGDVFFTISSETPSEIGMSSVLLDNIDELYLNSFCFGYRPNSLNELNPYFSRFLFRNELLRKEIVKLAQGSTRYNMSKIQFVKIEIDLPSNEEQTKIANFLTAIDQKIEHCKTQIDNTEKYKKGLLQKMFV